MAPAHSKPANPPGPPRVRLGEAARLAGITPQQLQYYLMIGVVHASDFSPTRRRLFDHHTIKKIRMVSLLNRSGYALREIREIFMENPGRRSTRQ